MCTMCVLVRIRMHDSPTGNSLRSNEDGRSRRERELVATITNDDDNDDDEDGVEIVTLSFSGGACFWTDH